MSLQGKAVGGLGVAVALTATMFAFPISAVADNQDADNDNKNDKGAAVTAVVVFYDESGNAWYDIDGDGVADGYGLDENGKLAYTDTYDGKQYSSLEEALSQQSGDTGSDGQGTDDTDGTSGEGGQGTGDGQGQANGDGNENAEAPENGELPSENSQTAEAVVGETASEVVAPAEPDKKAKQKAKKKSKKKSKKKAKSEKESDTEKLNRYGITDDVYPYQSGGVYLGSRAHTDFTTEKFIATIAEQARIYAAENDLYASVLIAQAVLESGNGNSGLAQAPNYNLFGIKGSYNGESVVMRTSEDAGDGTNYDIDARFRRYPSTAESIGDYVRLLNTDLYTNARKSVAKNYRKACESLQGVYATSTTYAQSLVSLIETYGLDEYDKPLKYKVEGKIYDPDSKKAGKNGYRKMTQDDYAALEAEVTSHIGMPYVWGGSDVKTGFDCSGLVQYCYKEALGIEISRTTFTQQYEGIEVPLNVNDLRMGDLLFFVDAGQGTHHVAMYLSNGYYVHAPQTGDVVKVTSMSEFKPTFAKRIITFDDQASKKGDDADELDSNENSVEIDDEMANDKSDSSADADSDSSAKAKSDDESDENSDGESDDKSDESDGDGRSKDADADVEDDESGDGPSKLMAGKIAKARALMD